MNLGLKLKKNHTNVLLYEMYHVSVEFKLWSTPRNAFWEAWQCSTLGTLLIEHPVVSSISDKQDIDAKIWQFKMWCDKGHMPWHHTFYWQTGGL